MFKQDVLNNHDIEYGFSWPAGPLGLNEYIKAIFRPNFDQFVSVL